MKRNPPTNPMTLTKVRQLRKDQTDPEKKLCEYYAIGDWQGSNSAVRFLSDHISPTSAASAGS